MTDEPKLPFVVEEPAEPSDRKKSRGPPFSSLGFCFLVVVRCIVLVLVFLNVFAAFSHAVDDRHKYDVQPLLLLLLMVAVDFILTARCMRRRPVSLVLSAALAVYMIGLIMSEECPDRESVNGKAFVALLNGIYLFGAGMTFFSRDTWASDGEAPVEATDEIGVVSTQDE